LEARLRDAGDANGAGITAFQKSLRRVEANLVTAGLGEYMTTIQLHAGKLWFAAKASNWDLAAYELHEIEETYGSSEETKRREKWRQNLWRYGCRPADANCATRGINKAEKSCRVSECL
jgi:hypothetical protein